MTASTQTNAPRRRGARVPARVTAHVYMKEPCPVPVTCDDVSMTGMRLTAAGLEIHPGQRLYIEFRLPQYQDLPVMAIGQVVWSEPEKGIHGLQITRHFPAGRFALRSFIERSQRRRINFNLFDSQ